MAEQHLPFSEGLPTRPDVDLLLKTWPEPKVGDRFAYEVIEQLLNLDRRDNRFRTVTTNWRKRMHENDDQLWQRQRAKWG